MDFDGIEKILTDPAAPDALRAASVLLSVPLRRVQRLTGIPYERLTRVLRGEVAPRADELDRVAAVLRDELRVAREWAA